MAKATIQIEAEKAQAMLALMEIENKTNAVSNAAKRMGTATKTTADSSTASLGSMAAKLGGVAAGYLGIGSAAGLAMKAIAALRQESERASQSGKQEAPAITGLFPLSGGDAARARQIMATQKDIAIREGINTTSSGEIIKAAFSGGMGLADARDIAGLTGITASPAQVAGSIGTIMAARGGTVAPGDPRRLINMGLVASAATGHGIDDVLAATGSVAQAAGNRIPVSELMAATVGLSDRTKTPRTAGSQIEAFLRGTDARGIGGTLAERAEKLAASGMSEKRMTSILGDQGLLAFRAIREMQPAITSARAKIEAAAAGTGTSTDALSRAQTMRDSLDPVSAEVRRAAVKKADADRAITDLSAAPALRREQAESDWETASAKAGQGAVRRWIPKILAYPLADERATAYLEAETARLQGRGPLAGGTFGSPAEGMLSGFQSPGSLVERGRPIRVILSGDERRRDDDLRADRQAGTE